jgi:hypothetical protein
VPPPGRQPCQPHRLRVVGEGAARRAELAAVVAPDLAGRELEERLLGHGQPLDVVERRSGGPETPGQPAVDVGDVVAVVVSVGVGAVDAVPGVGAEPRRGAAERHGQRLEQCVDRGRVGVVVE